MVTVNDSSALLFGGKNYEHPLDDVHLISPGTAACLGPYPQLAPSDPDHTRAMWRLNVRTDFRETDHLKPLDDAESFPVPSLFGQTALQIGSQMVVIGGKAHNSSSTEIYVFDLRT
jgi:hypothetical protein